MVNSIGKYLEKGNGVVDASEFGGYLHPTTEGVPLLPSGGIILTGRERKTLGYILPCSIEVRFHMNLDSIRSRRQGVSFGMWRRKWES